MRYGEKYSKFFLSNRVNATERNDNVQCKELKIWKLSYFKYLNSLRCNNNDNNIMIICNSHSRCESGVSHTHTQVAEDKEKEHQH